MHYIYGNTTLGLYNIVLNEKQDNNADCGLGVIM